ncbi:MAG: hypothetical protein KIT11_09200 [Fimbriimonadaceae bacterium]|nr:hypothetical protein [Fimbriimonadaceae bacterium]QYK55504.1 MAG: hypothetical protein KF733_10870 [Fimbriimonadaceae bacterium]
MIPASLLRHSAAWGIALVAGIASSQIPVAPERRIEPVRIAPAMLVDGEVVQTGPWQAAGGQVGRAAAANEIAFDLFEFLFDPDGKLYPDEVPGYGPSAGLGNPATRYRYVPFKRNTMVYNDMKLKPESAGAVAKRVAFAWVQGVAEPLRVFAATTENFNTANPNSSQARGDFTGVTIDFGTVPPGAGYYWADVDLGTLSLALPRDANGGYVLQQLAAANTFSTSNTFMMWGAKAQNPAAPQNPIEFQSLALNNGTFSLPGDQVDTRFGTPVDPLGTMFALLYEPPATIAPTTFTVSLGRLASGNLASLQSTDGNMLRVCKFIVPNLVVPPVQVQVDSASQPNLTPSLVKFRVTSRMGTTGLFSQTLDMFDWAGNRFDPVDTSTTVSNTTLKTDYATSSGSAARYVRTGSGTLRGRYQIRQTGPASALLWCQETDQAQWLVFD